MVTKMSEQLSQCIDRELDDGEQAVVLDAAVSNPQMREKWGHYHLIGSIMRNEVVSPGRDISESVAKALQNEPTLLAPTRMRDLHPRSEKGDFMSASRNDIWKPVGMLAVAASMAAVAVIALNPLTSEPSLTLAQSVQQSDDSVRTLDGKTDSEIKFANEFDEMLAEHGEFSSSAGLNGLVTYAKLVSAQRLEH